MEWLWAVLLTVAASHRPTRALALLLALKWAANYLAFRMVSETAPALIDVALGTVGVIWASRLQTRWADVLVAGFVLTPLVHAWYWFQQPGGAPSALTYYWLTVGLFSVQVAALAWPAALHQARALFRRWRSIGARPSSPG